MSKYQQNYNFRQNMRKKVIHLLILHLSFTKFLLFIYYSNIIRVTSTAITLRNGIKNTSNALGVNNVFTDKNNSYFFNVSNRTKAVSYVHLPNSNVVNIEKKLAFIPEYKPPLKIMPLGDSITAGVIGNNDRNSGGYRTELSKKFVAAGLKVKFVGSRSNGADNFSNKNHEGHPGWTIRQIADSVNKWLNTFEPDIVLLMIGTNDTNKSSLTTMIDELSALIDQITAYSPDVHLLVASIPPIHPTVKPALRGLRAMYFNTAIPVLVNSKVAQGKKVYFVDMRSLTVNDLTASLSLDLDSGLHPHAQGYRKIANLWYDAVIKVTNKRLNESAVCLHQLVA